MQDNMLRRLFILTFILLHVAAYAQTEKEIIDMVGKASAEMQSLECDFVQTKHLKILNDKMVSKGKMYYMQPGRLRWEYTSPYTYTFILNDSQVLLKNSTRSDVIDVNQNRIFKEIARLMMNSILGNCLTDEKSFQTDIETKGQEWIATLVPLKKDMKQMWTKLVLHYDSVKKSVVMVEMHEKTGDYTEIRLDNIKINRQIAESTFSIQ